MVDVETPRRALRRVGGWEYRWLCLLLLVVLAMHFGVITRPAQLVFDEQHYVKDARAILSEHETHRPEHPPLGKLIIASGMRVFGDNPVGWRFFSVLFGTASVLLFYLICRRLRLSRRISLLATFLLAFDNLSFVQASVAMLDVYSLTFMLCGFWLYLRGDYPLSAVSIGLSTLAKLTGALGMVVIVLHWLLARRSEARRFLPSILVAPACFLSVMPFLDFAISGKWLNPIDQTGRMLSLSGTLTFANTSSQVVSRPWEWLVRPEIMAYWYDPHYLGAESFTIGALIVPTMLYMAFLASRKSGPALFGISWFAGTYLPWIPASIITDRISFVYYFYPTVGAICIGLALGLGQLLQIRRLSNSSRLRRAILATVLGYLLLHAIVFVVLSPLSTWWSVPAPT